MCTETVYSSLDEACAEIQRIMNVMERGGTDKHVLTRWIDAAIDCLEDAKNEVNRG